MDVLLLNSCAGQQQILWETNISVEHLFVLNLLTIIILIFFHNALVFCEKQQCTFPSVAIGCGFAIKEK